MADHRLTDEHAKETTARTHTLKRRGLIAGAATLVAGLVAQRAQPVGATNGDLLKVGNVGAGGPQTATATTTIAATTAAGNPGLRVTTNFTATPDPIANGVQGFATTASVAGVFGRNNDANGYGLHGEAPAGIGVYGHSSSGYGVVGMSPSNYGVVGLSTTSYGVYSNTTTNHAICGQSSVAGLAGIYGTASGANALGLVASASSGAYAGAFYGPVALNGVTTASAAGAHSVTAYGNTANYAGMLGAAEVTGAIGVYGYAAPVGAYAGYFTGPVTVAGDFAVTGSKSAAVKDPTDGAYRLLYCVESPEAWFEDFGAATFTAGKATVTLDPAFAVLVDTSGYHVFLTEQDDHNALFVASRSATGFVVQAKNAPGGTGTFSYRVVARRKDGTHPRLAKVVLPDATKLTVPPPPQVALKGTTPGKP